MRLEYYLVGKTMLDAFKLFDPYGLRARLFPALIAGLPTLAFLFVLVPWDHLGLSHAIAASMGAVLLFAFADVARRTGKGVEAKLGTRATPELLRHDNDVFDRASKERYKAFLALRIGRPIPTEQDENDDPTRANEFFLSAGNWLREHTRDTKKYKILFDEVITYGFRRNLLGLKPVSIALNIAVIAACLSILHFSWGYFHVIRNIEVKLWIVTVAAVVHSAYMGLAVGSSAVRDASQAYGRQLILSTESFITLTGAPPAKPRRPRKPSAPAGGT